MRRASVALLTLPVLLLSGCGGDPGATRLPETTAFDVASGDDVVVAELSRGRPTLVWFWAPHCSRCAAEAAEVEDFARSNPEIDVVGLGTQDDLALAREFQDRHEISSVRMLWEDGYDSWRELGVRVQPAMILFDADGDRVARWDGTFDPSEVADALPDV